MLQHQHTLTLPNSSHLHTPSPRATHIHTHTANRPTNAKLSAVAICLYAVTVGIGYVHGGMRSGFGKVVQTLLLFIQDSTILWFAVAKEFMVASYSGEWTPTGSTKDYAVITIAHCVAVVFIISRQHAFVVRKAAYRFRKVLDKSHKVSCTRCNNVHVNNITYW